MLYRFSRACYSCGGRDCCVCQLRMCSSMCGLCLHQDEEKESQSSETRPPAPPTLRLFSQRRSRIGEIFVPSRHLLPLPPPGCLAAPPTSRPAGSPAPFVLRGDSVSTSIVHRPAEPRRPSGTATEIRQRYGGLRVPHSFCTVQSRGEL